MTATTGLSALALAALLAAQLMLGCHDDREGQRPEDRKQRARVLAGQARELGEQLEGVETVRRLLWWYGLTGKEPGQMEALAAGSSQLVTFDRLFRLRELENSPHVDDGDRRRLRHLRVALTTHYLHRRVARQQDRYLDLISRPTVRIPSVEQPVRFTDLSALVAGTQQRDRRSRLQGRRVPLLKQLDRLLHGIYQRIREDARRLGVNAFEIAEQSEERDTRSLLSAAVTRNTKSAALFRFVWQAVAAPLATRDAPLRISDLAFVREGGTHQAVLVERSPLAALERLLQDLGLELRGTDGERIRVADTGLVTACLPVRPPGDVRLLHRPEGGLWAQIQLFEAAGQAICLARGEARQTGADASHLGARALGHLLGLVGLEPGWWRRYGELRGPPLSEARIQDLVRARILVGLLRLRVQAVVVPILRAAAEGGPSRTYEGVWSKGTQGTLGALFARLMEAQVGIVLGSDDALTYVDELGPLRPSFDLRAYALAHMLLELVRREHGPQWFTRAEVGDRLVKGLCQQGGGSAAALVARFGLERPDLDLDAPWSTFAAAWEQLHTR